MSKVSESPEALSREQIERMRMVLHKLWFAGESPQSNVADALCDMALRSLPDGLVEGPTIIKGPLPSQAVEEYRKRYGFLPSEESTYTLIDDVIKLLESHECRAAAKALQAAMKHIPNVPTYQPREQAVRVPRDFLEATPCPNCAGVGWYAVPNRNSGEPEQQQCQWCDVKAAAIARSQEVNRD